MDKLKENHLAMDADLNANVDVVTNHVAKYNNWRRGINDFTSANDVWQVMQKIMISEIVYGGPKAMLLVKQMLEYGHFCILTTGKFGLARWSKQI